MNTGRYVVSQIMDLVHRQTLDRLVARYGAETRVRHFGCRQQLICMAFAQLTWRESLRDIEACLNAKPEALYHLGFREPLARSTLAEANEQRNWRLWRDLSLGLIAQARRLYAGENLGLEFANTVYALDSTTIDLSLTLFPWADFRSTKAGIKLHTQLDLRGPIPVVIDITAARQHDVLWLDELIFEAAAFYVLDRGYVDFARLARIAHAGAFFVTRAKDNLRFTRQHSRPVNFATGLQRSNRQTDAGQISRRLPLVAAQGALLRCGNQTHLGFPQQQPFDPRPERGAAVPTSLAGRTFLPVDQTEPAHQTFLRQQWQRCAHANLDCGRCLRDDRDPAQGVETARHIAQNIADFECSSV